VQIQDKPILTGDDVIAYNKAPFQMKLTPGSYKRIMETEGICVVMIRNKRVSFGEVRSQYNNNRGAPFFILKNTVMESENDLENMDKLLLTAGKLNIIVINVFGGPFDCPQPEQVIDSLAKENKAASLYKEFVLQTVLLDKTKAGFEGKVELVAQKPILFEGDPGYKAGTQDNYYNDFLFPGLKLLDANDRIITTRGFRSLIHQESISLSQVDLYGDGRPVFEVCIKFGPGSGIRYVEIMAGAWRKRHGFPSGTA
jgi:hypothetical protein